MLVRACSNVSKALAVACVVAMLVKNSSSCIANEACRIFASGWLTRYTLYHKCAKSRFALLLVLGSSRDPRLAAQPCFRLLMRAGVPPVLVKTLVTYASLLIFMLFGCLFESS